ncbi:type III secretion system chaperone [bacterium]|nr:type III secretion system chaperone [bacterium]
MLDNLISDLEKFMGVSLIQEETKEGISYSLTLEDGKEIILAEKDTTIFLFTKLCHFTETSIPSPEDFYMFAGKANHPFVAGDVTISLSPDEKFLTLTMLIDYEVNYKMFLDLLEDFANAVSYWEKELKTKLEVDK